MSTAKCSPFVKVYWLVWYSYSLSVVHVLLLSLESTQFNWFSSIAFTLEDELPDYDCDEEDNHWLDLYNKKYPKEGLSILEFERIIDTLEKGCGSRLDVSIILIFI